MLISLLVCDGSIQKSLIGIVLEGMYPLYIVAAPSHFQKDKFLHRTYAN